MGLRPLYIVLFFSAGFDFRRPNLISRRQILKSKSVSALKVLTYTIPQVTLKPIRASGAVFSQRWTRHGVEDVFRTLQLDGCAMFVPAQKSKNVLSEYSINIIKLLQ